MVRQKCSGIRRSYLGYVKNNHGVPSFGINMEDFSRLPWEEAQLQSTNFQYLCSFYAQRYP